MHASSIHFKPKTKHANNYRPPLFFAFLRHFYSESLAYEITGFHEEIRVLLRQILGSEITLWRFSLQQPFAVTLDKRGGLFILIIGCRRP